jgi:hypothetical protein
MLVGRHAHGFSSACAMIFMPTQGRGHGTQSAKPFNRHEPKNEPDPE